ncbi:protein phosphatase 2c [Zymoseptoria brevis]|uniref:Protein phosphatase 2c n=1 Tax=Zymoseptoria brevis TaxID=1047168 RepID=A0A0F4G7F2_9PEZI|nr:protein phosphatase 2c [Zymoseptoria brevis]
MKHTGVPFSIARSLTTLINECRIAQRREFHDYFVTHLPSTSLAPDKLHPSHHKLPRADSQPHDGSASRSSQVSAARDTTIVRIPLKSAKHHFGAGVSRGSRPYNEDTYQAGCIEIPAFAKKQPVSISHRKLMDENVGSTRQTGDPQVFYFGVFDGHGGSECSEFLRERLHGYIEESALLFGMESTLQESGGGYDTSGGIMGEMDPEDLQKSLVSSWKETVGGYFKRFRPEYFPALARDDAAQAHDPSSIETVLTYAFLKADLDFTTAQATKHTKEVNEQAQQAQRSSIDDPVLSDRPLNDNDVLSNPDRPASQNLRTRPASRGSSPDLNAPIGGNTRFKGGSTASIVLVSTPSPTPFWNPSSPSTIIAAHVGDTRILLCQTKDGAAIPLTSNHHPSLPTEATRLRRYATSFVTDSFGEERVLGLANTRAFGDVGSKRIGVSAEPQITTIQLPPAGYAFMVLVSDGISGHLEDQEIVDIVKEARTPVEASHKLVSFAVETAGEADNATALVVRLGGWERRNEGGGGSLGTKEQRDFRMRDAFDPRSRRQ